jgi:hypothetical protein
MICRAPSTGTLVKRLTMSKLTRMSKRLKVNGLQQMYEVGQILDKGFCSFTKGAENLV